VIARLGNVLTVATRLFESVWYAVRGFVGRHLGGDWLEIKLTGLIDRTARARRIARLLEVASWVEGTLPDTAAELRARADRLRAASPHTD
jgi:hypothetical protein